MGRNEALFSRRLNLAKSLVLLESFKRVIKFIILYFLSRHFEILIRKR